MATGDNIPQSSPLAKLFHSDASKDKELQKIRDRIYSFAWSRDRRDEAKLDWVLSENDVNRNVHLRWIDEASSGSKRDHINGLPCWLLLVNKQISADFTRFIYSVNDLDILVDLKADHTIPNEAKLDTVVKHLQNANFQCYTKSVRVRIHFPDKYTFQNLPVFNQHALDNIAVALDAFQQLAYLSVRIVPMQGPEDYELRLATFPFYPMSMTNWSIRMLNCETYNWDVVGGEKLHHLNLAWDLFQATGSLTATINAPEDAEKPTIHLDRVPETKDIVNVPKKLVVGQKKNGSQKRKGRKLKALSAATTPSVSETTPMIPSDCLSLRSSSPSVDPSKGGPPGLVSRGGSDLAAESSHAESSITELPEQAAGDFPDPAPTIRDAAGTSHQSSPPDSSTKPENTSSMNHIAAAETDNEAVENDNAAEQRPPPADTVDPAREEHESLEISRKTSPASSAPSSVTLGREQSEDEAAIHNTVDETPHVESTLRGAGADSKPAKKKKKKNRKKGKKTQSTDTADIQSDEESGQQTPVKSEDNGSTFYISIGALKGLPIGNGSDGIISNKHRRFPLAEIVELIPCPGDERLLQYKRANGRHGMIVRCSEIDRLLRQKERMATLEAERQTEKVRAKGKRKTKKVKEVMIRRKEPSEGLRRGAEDTRQLAGDKQGSDLRKRFNEITGEVPAPQTDSSEVSDSSNEDDFPPEDAWSFAGQDNYPQPEYFGTTPVTHRRQPSSFSPDIGSRTSRSTQDFMYPSEDTTCEDGSHVEQQGVEKLGYAGIGHNDEPVSFDSHDYNQRTMSFVAGCPESRSDPNLGENAAGNFSSTQQRYHRDRQMEAQPLVKGPDDWGDCASVMSQYGDEGPPSISDDGSTSPET